MSFAKRLRRFTLLIFCISLVTAQSRDEVIELTHPVTGSMVDTNFVDVEVRLDSGVMQQFSVKPFLVGEISKDWMI